MFQINKVNLNGKNISLQKFYHMFEKFNIFYLKIKKNREASYLTVAMTGFSLQLTSSGT